MSQIPPPGAAPPPGAPIKTYLVESILVTLCCCLPLGIVGIVNAAKAGSLEKAGDMAGAQAAADDAKKFMKIGLIIGLVVNGLGIGFYAIMIILAAMSQ